MCKSSKLLKNRSVNYDKNKTPEMLSLVEKKEHQKVQKKEMKFKRNHSYRRTSEWLPAVSVFRQFSFSQRKHGRCQSFPIDETRSAETIHFLVSSTFNHKLETVIY